MISEILQSIEGVGVYPTISILVFFAAFVCMVLWVIGLKSEYRRKMKNLPLEEERGFKDVGREDG